MHPALWKLLRLTDKASWRTLFRGARTIRGALLLIFLIGIAGLYVVFLVGITFFMRGRTDFPDFAGTAGALPAADPSGDLPPGRPRVARLGPPVFQPRRDRLPVRRAVPPPRPAPLQIDPEGHGAGRGLPDDLRDADLVVLEWIAVGFRRAEPGIGLREPRQSGRDPGPADRRGGRPDPDPQDGADRGHDAGGGGPAADLLASPGPSFRRPWPRASARPGRAACCWPRSRSSATRCSPSAGSPT